MRSSSWWTASRRRSPKTPRRPEHCPVIPGGHRRAAGRPGAPCSAGRGPFPKQDAKPAPSSSPLPAQPAAPAAGRKQNRLLSRPPPTTKPVLPLRRSRTISTSPGKRPSTLLRRNPSPSSPSMKRPRRTRQSRLRPAQRRRRPRFPGASTVKTSAPTPQAEEAGLNVRSKRPKKRASRKSAASAGGPRTRRGGKQFIRVNIERLDNLMNLVGEMVVNRNRLIRQVELIKGLREELAFSQKRPPRRGEGIRGKV